MIGNYMMQQEQDRAMEEEEMALREEEKAGALEQDEFMNFLMSGMPKEQQAQLGGMSPENIMRALQMGPSMGIDYFPQEEPELEDTYDPNQMTMLMRIFAEAGLPGLSIYQGVPEYEEELSRLKDTPSATIEGMFGPQEDPVAGAVGAFGMEQYPGFTPFLEGMSPEDAARAIPGMLGLLPEPTEDQYYQFGAGGGTLLGPEGPTVIPPVETGRAGMRTDRHNNPTAMTTDVARQFGLVEGTDFMVGDPFPDNPNLRTATLIGNGMDTTIMALDNAAQSEDMMAFFTASGQPRWSYTSVSDEEWLAKTPEQKVDFIDGMYQMEGGAYANTGFRGGGAEPEVSETVYDLSSAELEDYFYANASPERQAEAINAAGGQARVDPVTGVLRISRTPPQGLDYVYRELWESQAAEREPAPVDELSEYAQGVLSDVWGKYLSGATPASLGDYIDGLVEAGIITPEDGDVVANLLADALSES